VVRAHRAAQQAKIPLVVGARLDFRSGESVLCLPTDRAAYGRLAKLVTLGRRRAPKGECHLDPADLFACAEGQMVVALAPERADATFAEFLDEISRRFPGRGFLAGHHLYRGDDARRLAELADLAAARGVPLIATNDVHMHDPARRPLQDVLTCIREHCTIDEAGFRLTANAERHLKPPAEMARLFRDDRGGLPLQPRRAQFRLSRRGTG
jgi:error-prone DNA polymerase